MTAPTTTRRDILRFGTSAAAYAAGAAGAAIVTGGVALASQAKGAAPAAISPALARLLADRDAADATLDRWYEAVWNPAVERSRDARSMIPHVQVDTPALPGSVGAGHSWTTENSSHVSFARSIAMHPAHRGNQSEAYLSRRRDARRFIAGHLRRERALARAGRETAALRIVEDEMWKPVSAADRAIEAFAVASLADLAAKLAHIERTSDPDGDLLLSIVQADVARLASQEGR